MMRPDTYTTSLEERQEIIRRNLEYLMATAPEVVEEYEFYVTASGPQIGGRERMLRLRNVSGVRAS